jgi:hypothetical protein
MCKLIALPGISLFGRSVTKPVKIRERAPVRQAVSATFWMDNMIRIWILEIGY